MENSNRILPKTKQNDARDYSTQGEDRWPGDPDKMRDSQDETHSEIWNPGSNYISPSKWQEHGSEAASGYFNQYKSDKSTYTPSSDVSDVDKKERTDDSVSRSMS